MATQAQFLNLLVDIEPSATTKTIASSAQRNLRQYLAEHETFANVHVDTFLSGSYARDTSIRPRIIDGKLSRPDVDIIVVTNHTRDDDPTAVIEELLNCLEEEYDIKDPDNDRSVGVATASVKMDIVPIIAAPPGDQYMYYVPDRRLGKWFPTNPPGHISWATEINKTASERFKPLVKLFKWWRRENPTAEGSNRPKGFVIEKIVADCMSYSEKYYGELFAVTLEGVVRTYASYHVLGLVPQIQDPSVAGNIITSRLSFADFSAFYKKAEAHAKIARQALAEEDDEKAREMWVKIFGQRFPASGKKSLAESLLSAAVTPAPLVFPDRAVVPKTPGGFA